MVHRCRSQRPPIYDFTARPTSNGLESIADDGEFVGANAKCATGRDIPIAVIGTAAPALIFTAPAAVAKEAGAEAFAQLTGVDFLTLRGIAKRTGKIGISNSAPRVATGPGRNQAGFIDLGS